MPAIDTHAAFARNLEMAKRVAITGVGRAAGVGAAAGIGAALSVGAGAASGKPMQVPPMINAAVVIPDPAPPASEHTVVVNALTAALIDPSRALVQLSVLIDAFAEVDEYDPKRHHNQPPPSMWLDNRKYLGDLRSLLHELRRLNDQLERLAKTQTPQTPPATTKTVGLLSVAATKFVEAYAADLGKKASGLTFLGIAALLGYLGVKTGTVDVIFGTIKQLK
jgi:hypothetical protein